MRYVDGKHSWQSTDRELPNSLLLALGVCDEDAFPNIYRPLVIACILPMTSAEAERSFSLMKWIKNCSRSTMLKERLSDLAVIAIYYSERFEVEEICQAFVKDHPRRLFQASASLFDWIGWWKEDKHLSLLHCTISASNLYLILTLTLPPSAFLWPRNICPELILTTSSLKKSWIRP